MLKFRIAQSTLKRFFSQIIPEEAQKEADLRKCFTIIQSVEVVAANKRLKILQNKIEEHKDKKMLILCNNEEGTSLLKKDLQELFIFPRTLSGASLSMQDNHIIKNFESKDNGLLIALNNYFKKINLANVSCLINYSIPLTIEEYNEIVLKYYQDAQKGEMLSFFTTNDDELADQLILSFIESHQNIPLSLAEFRRTMIYKSKTSRKWK
ncbi:DBP3 [Blepharisma stoltei]|uniref:Helicase C-terminal domain-containing protein n=1 Tax=Blepharisma stoltei TaxID=1481888 RepID=A0AAU9JBC2_9CILI|nr:unnamed protein product [Blepharisma stoltei]